MTRGTCRCMLTLAQRSIDATHTSADNLMNWPWYGNNSLLLVAVRPRGVVLCFVRQVFGKLCADVETAEDTISHVYQPFASRASMLNSEPKRCLIDLTLLSSRSSLKLYQLLPLHRTSELPCVQSFVSCRLMLRIYQPYR